MKLSLLRMSFYRKEKKSIKRLEVKCLSKSLYFIRLLCLGYKVNECFRT